MPNSPSGANPGLHGYTTDRNKLLEILNSLHSSGIQNDVDLPQVVVLGSQSVGKSSLIESISGLKLPRDLGTCTRCPMEFRLQNDPESAVDITLRFTKDATNQELQQVLEFPFQSGTTDPARIESALRDAQRVILQPSLLKQPGLGRPEDPPLTFSENCVCVHVKGPLIPDLLFFDIPGVISSVPDGVDRRHIQLVRNLAQSYCSRPNCIVLLVTACNYDFENQAALQDFLSDSEIRQRTIGVLTKVDMIEPGREEEWAQYLKNKRVALPNGWFAVKLPAKSQLGTNWEEARKTERNFFASTEPWKSLDVAHQQHLGSQQLSEHISKILSDLVAQKLPKIHREVARILHQIDNQLSQLPDRNLDDPHKQVITLICDFTKKISAHMQGVPPKYGQVEEGLIYAINGVFDHFKDKIYETAPQFRPWSSKISLDPTTLDEVVKKASFDHLVGEKGTIMHLNEVMDLARRSRTRELPGDIPHSVKDTLIRHFMITWDELMRECFNEVEDILTRHVNTMLREHFAAYAHGGLLDEVNIVVQQQIYQCATSTKQRIDALCSMDLQPYTQNQEYYDTCRRKLYLRYKTLYQQSQPSGVAQGFIDILQSNAIARGFIDSMVSPELTAVLEGLAKLGLPLLQPMDLTALLPTDEFDPALVVMADVRAYFQVAYKRFTDAIPKFVDHEFLRAFESSVDIALRQMVPSTEQCVQFLQGAPEDNKLRNDLLGRKKRLDAAREKLDTIFMSSNASQPPSTSSSLGDTIPLPSLPFVSGVSSYLGTRPPSLDRLRGYISGHVP